jgi:hypothetical protein
MPFNSSNAALRALGDLRSEVTKRAGKPGGHLNKMVNSLCDVIEVALHDIQPTHEALSLARQQSEVIVRQIRERHRAALLQTNDSTTGDDGSSTTKGQ